MIRSYFRKYQMMNFSEHINLSFSLPYGKSEDTTSPSLSRVRGMWLQLHPRRLGSAASSNFAACKYV